MKQNIIPKKSEHTILCFNWVSTGSCPYKNCKFIHDPRIESKNKENNKNMFDHKLFSKNMQKNNNFDEEDLLYWPKNIRKSNKPIVEYESENRYGTKNDKIVKKIWDDFIERISGLPK